MPVDWTGLAGVIMGTLIILIPVAGLTARFALKPIVEAIAHIRQQPTGPERLQSIESRLALVEAQLENAEKEIDHLMEEREFQKELGRGGTS